MEATIMTVGTIAMLAGSMVKAEYNIAGNVYTMIYKWFVK